MFKTGLHILLFLVIILSSCAVHSKFPFICFRRACGNSNFSVRGVKKKIEGKVVSPVVIVDDVLTSGNSIKDAIDAVKQTGVSVKGVVCVIDREEETTNVLKQHKIRYSSLFTHSDFKSFIEQKLMNKRQDQKT